MLRIFSSINAFRRQVRVGVLHLFKESIEHGVKIRVLIPADYQQITEIINEVNLVLPELSIRSVDMSLQNTIGILVVDRRQSLIIETKDDTNPNPERCRESCIEYQNHAQERLLITICWWIRLNDLMLIELASLSYAL